MATFALHHPRDGKVKSWDRAVRDVRWRGVRRVLAGGLFGWGIAAVVAEGLSVAMLVYLGMLILAALYIVLYCVVI
jgi:hypothetical protein